MNIKIYVFYTVLNDKQRLRTGAAVFLLYGSIINVGATHIRVVANILFLQ